MMTTIIGNIRITNTPTNMEVLNLNRNLENP